MNFSKAFMAATATVALSLAAASASAATLDQEVFTDYALAKNFESDFLAGLSNYVTEDFESIALQSSVTVNTSVGTFEQLEAGQLAGGLLVRDSTGTTFGRRDTTAANNPAGKWLDSNDSKKVEWKLSFTNDIKAIGFFLTDVNDVSASMTVEFADGLGTETLDLESPNGSAGNGEISYVTALFDNSVSSIIFNVNKPNDGWGIDDISVSAVPLPAAAWMLLAGVAGLGYAGRRKKA